MTAFTDLVALSPDSFPTDFGNGAVCCIGPDGLSYLFDPLHASSCYRIEEDGTVTVLASFPGTRVAAAAPDSLTGTLVVVDGGPTLSQSFSYTGAGQNFIVPSGVTSLYVELSGAEGSPGDGASGGGSGATIRAAVTVVPGETLKLFLGEKTGTINAGFNGGGRGGGSSTDGGGGGGGTDIRRSPYTLADRLVVAGGGGGGGGYTFGSPHGAGGNGGAPVVGGDGTSGPFGTKGLGGTGSAGGAASADANGCASVGAHDALPGVLGVGGDGIKMNGCLNVGGGGGGGGLYGGGGGGRSSGGGGGSSGLGAGATLASYGVGHTGNGTALVQWGGSGATCTYDIAGDSWASDRASAPYTARTGIVWAVLGRKIYVFGGQDASSPYISNYLDDAWVYDIDADSWTELGTIPKEVGYGNGVPFNGNLYVFTSERDGTPFFYRYRPASDDWAVIERLGSDDIALFNVGWAANVGENLIAVNAGFQAPSWLGGTAAINIYDPVSLQFFNVPFDTDPTANGALLGAASDPSSLEITIASYADSTFFTFGLSSAQLHLSSLTYRGSATAAVPPTPTPLVRLSMQVNGITVLSRITQALGAGGYPGLQVINQDAGGLGAAAEGDTRLDSFSVVSAIGSGTESFNKADGALGPDQTWATFTTFGGSPVVVGNQFGYTVFPFLPASGTALSGALATSLLTAETVTVQATVSRQVPAPPPAPSTYYQYKLVACGDGVALNNYYSAQWQTGQGFNYLTIYKSLDGVITTVASKYVGDPAGSGPDIIVGDVLSLVVETLA